MKGRIKNKRVAIDHNTVKNVFETVATKAKTKLSSCMLDMNDEYATDRHKQECYRISKTIGTSYDHVLDIGCGIGRLRGIFPTAEYTGVDFCEAYINEAKQIHRFDTLICHDVSKLDEVCNESYDLALMCGICMYLSDEELDKIFSFLKKQKECTFYLRESISILNERLTLKDFPSSDLGIPYSAIYRTRDEYERLIMKHFPKATPFISEPLQKGEKQIRKETNQMYFVWHN